MEAFLVANIAPIMFVGLIVFLLLGYPVAFALAANGIFFGLLGIKLGLLQPVLFQALPERMWGVMSNDTLLAVPFFTFMGLILWPARLLLPIGFALLVLQGLSELMKRIAFVAGKGPDPIVRHDPAEAERELAEEIRKMAEGKIAEGKA